MKRILGIILLLGIFGCLFGCETKHYNEWVEKQGAYYYYNENGEIIKGIDCFIDHDWYYFDENGKMLTDWHYNKERKAYVYLGNDGKVRKGWQKINNNWYFFGKTFGLMLTDWQKIDGEWYYFDKKNGDLKTSTFIDNTYFVDENGKMIHSGWFNINGQMLYFENDGKINHNRNYEQEIRSQQDNNKHNSNKSDFNSSIKFEKIHFAHSINSQLNDCIKYYKIAMDGEFENLLKLERAVNGLKDSRDASYNIDTGTGKLHRGSGYYDIEIVKEYNLLDALITELKSFLSYKYNTIDYN